MHPLCPVAGPILAPVDERIDLHTHSHHSDGVLPPAALVELAAARGVSLLALTDHDTVAGCAEARAAGEKLGVRCIAGIELSCGWRGQSIHVVGLGVEEGHAGIDAWHRAMLARRRERIREIGERLERKAKLPGREIAQGLLEREGVPTRLHFAQALLERGLIGETQEAFDRWLNGGGAGHVPTEWPALAEGLALLRESARAIVLAHPHRYRLSGGALRQLCADFREDGGHALEVSLAGLSQGDSERLATLALRAGLEGSAASDFHDPATPWRPLGRFAKLPAGIAPVTDRLRGA